MRPDFPSVTLLASAPVRVVRNNNNNTLAGRSRHRRHRHHRRRQRAAVMPAGGNTITRTRERYARVQPRTKRSTYLAHQVHHNAPTEGRSESHK